MCVWLCGCRVLQAFADTFDLEGLTSDLHSHAPFPVLLIKLMAEFLAKVRAHTQCRQLNQFFAAHACVLSGKHVAKVVQRGQGIQSIVRWARAVLGATFPGGSCWYVPQRARKDAK